MGNMGLNLLEIYKKSYELLKSVFGENISVPVDVYKIAEKLNIYVVTQSLNHENCDIENKLISTSFFTSNEFVCLLEADINPDKRKLALSRVIGKICLFENDKSCCNYLTNPEYFIETKEMMCDIFANFILMPPHLLLKEYDRYMSLQKESVEVKHWLKYVSIVFSVPYEETVAGYYQTRNLCALLANVKEDKLGTEEAIQKVLSIKK